MTAALAGAVRLCRRAAAGLVGAALTLPLAQALLLGAQLLVLRHLAGALLSFGPK